MKHKKTVQKTVKLVSSLAIYRFPSTSLSCIDRAPSGGRKYPFKFIKHYTGAIEVIVKNQK